MANEEDIRKLASENAQIRLDWLNHANEVAAAISEVQQSMQWDLLCAQTFDAIPAGQSLPDTEYLFNQLAVENTYLKSNQPKLPEVATFAGTGSALAYSVGTKAASLLSGHAQNGTTEIKAWAIQSLARFAQPLQEDASITMISSKLDRLYSGLTKEFQEAKQTTRSVLACASIDSSAGIAMRNVIENLKGNMLYVARQRSGNKNLSKWEEAARIIAKNGPASFEANQLVAIEDDWKKLHFDTTGLSKNNSTMSRSDVEATYFRWLGLLRSALTYIELFDGA